MGLLYRLLFSFLTFFTFHARLRFTRQPIGVIFYAMLCLRPHLGCVFSHFLGVSKCQTQKGKDVRIWATRKTIWPRLSQKMVKLARWELSNNVRFWAAAPVEAFHKMCCLWLLFQVKYTLKLHNFCNLRLSGSRRSNFQFSLSNGVSRRSN